MEFGRDKILMFSDNIDPLNELFVTSAHVDDSDK